MALFQADQLNDLLKPLLKQSRCLSNYFSTFKPWWRTIYVVTGCFRLMVFGIIWTVIERSKKSVHIYINSLLTFAFHCQYYICSVILFSKHMYHQIKNVSFILWDKIVWQNIPMSVTSCIIGESLVIYFFKSIWHRFFLNSVNRSLPYFIFQSQLVIYGMI